MLVINILLMISQNFSLRRYPPHLQLFLQFWLFSLNFFANNQNIIKFLKNENISFDGPIFVKIGPKFQNMISLWVLIRLTWNFYQRFLDIIRSDSQKYFFSKSFKTKLIAILYFFAFLAYVWVYLKSYISGNKQKIKILLLRIRAY